MELKGEDYKITYDAANAAIRFQGILRLRGVADYTHITQLLDQVVSQAPPSITLDLSSLKFLNSSGINVLFRFIIKTRERAVSSLVIHGAANIPWQEKSLKNMLRLMPGLQIRWG